MESSLSHPGFIPARYPAIAELRAPKYRISAESGTSSKGQPACNLGVGLSEPRGPRGRGLAAAELGSPLDLARSRASSVRARGRIFAGGRESNRPRDLRHQGVIKEQSQEDPRGRRGLASPQLGGGWVADWCASG